jgi:hypothetical protein
MRKASSSIRRACPLGRPATPGGGLWRADRCRYRVVWRGAASGICSPRVAGGPPPGAGSAWRRTTAGHPRRAESHRGQTVTDSHTPGLPATPATERTGGSRRATRTLPNLGIDNHHWDTPQNRPSTLTSISSGAYQMGHPAPSAATRSLVAGRFHAKEVKTLTPLPTFHNWRLRQATGRGRGVSVVMDVLGHKSAKVTLDTYADLFDDDLDAVALILHSRHSRANAATRPYEDPQQTGIPPSA